ncbi:MAG: TadE/TadG family type IV pilus assembly protein [Oricola sp.]
MPMTLLKRYRDNRKGSTAIEFGLLVLPFAALLFGIIEASLLYFQDDDLQAALNHATRKVRTGQLSSSGGTRMTDFKAAICKQMAIADRCADNILVRVSVISDMSAVALENAIGGDGAFEVSETFNTGKAGDFILAQAFIPWAATVDIYSFSSVRLSDGRYVIAAADIFRNEPF